MRIVATDLIEDGMKLAKPIYVGNCLILKAGTKHMTRYIKSLLNMRVRYVCVEDKQSEGIVIPDTISDEARMLCKERLENVILDFRQNQHFKLGSLTDSINDIIDEVSRHSEAQINLLDLNSTDEYTMTHSVNTMIYALILAKELKLSEYDIQQLVMGSLLHDIGKSFLDHDIMFKEGKLSKDEFDYIKKHSLYGYEIIKNVDNISNSSKDIVLHHHERLDGSGYPDGLKGEEISLFSRMVAVADVFDALTTDRCYRKKWSTAQALDFLVESAGNHLELGLVHSFMQLVAIYPTGSTVRLSDNRLGIVSEQNRYMPLRPIVRVITNEAGEPVKPYELNLMEVFSVTILNSEVEIDLSHASVAFRKGDMELESNN